VEDIFVSYTSSDREWAEWIRLELEELGRVAHVHEWEIKGGDDIYGWMQMRLDGADRVLCVVSDAYLKAPFSTLERNAALWRMAKDKPGFVLLVVVEPCTLPTLSDHLRRCELYGVPKDAARLRFRQFIEAPLKPEAVAFPGKVFAVSNILVRVPAHFLGRDEDIKRIDEALNLGEGRVAIAVLHGMRGVGKTTLAAAYAERRRDAYRATWWIQAQTESSMRADLVSLGIRLRWVTSEEQELALAAVRERLRHEGEGLLLIYDNAIDAASVRRYLPEGGAAHVLVTSNAHAWRGIAAPVEIKVWPKGVGAEYLMVRTGRTQERGDAEALSEALDGLPLAHEQAGAYCERLGVSLAEYRNRFEAAPARLLDTGKDAAADYGLTVAKTFALAIDEAAKLHVAAESLITHAALLAPEPIPLFLFSEARELFGEPLASGLADDGLDEAIAALRAFALVDRETVPDEREPTILTDTIRLHRLVRAVAAGALQGEAAEAGRKALIEAMATIYPRNVESDPSSWPRARRLDLLAFDLVGVETPMLPGEEANTSRLLDRLGSYRQNALAAYNAARPLYERALVIRETSLGSKDLAIVTLDHLGNLLRLQGDFPGARSFYERALALCEETVGPEDQKTATILASLALVVQAQGDLKGARILCERALAIHERELGSGNPRTMTSLNNLAHLLIVLGEAEGARHLFARALAIRERTIGPENSATVISMGNLASALMVLDDYAGAKALYERALAIRERTLSPDHPDIALSLGNLAQLLGRQGDFAAARPYFERALAIEEKMFGNEHLGTTTTLNNFGQVLYQQGDFGAARGFFERALATREKVLGPRNPQTATSMMNLGAVLEAQGDLVGARALYQRALPVREAVFGPNHPITNASRVALAQLNQKMAARSRA
jgi:tetratricopeptide (TPR) repeat protein